MPDEFSLILTAMKIDHFGVRPLDLGGDVQFLTVLANVQDLERPM